MAIITISRQYGSGGQEIATLLCDLLGYRYFDKRLMAQVASEVALSDQEIVDFCEDNYTVRGFSERLFGSNRRETQSGSPVPDLKADAADTKKVTEVEKPDEEYCINLVQNIICAAYKRDNIVIVGRGGQALLKDKPNVLHVRIEAPLFSRAQRLQVKENLTIAQGLETVDSRDRAAEAYLRRFYQIDWTDPMLYHLTINTGKWRVEDAAQIIADATKLLKPERIVD